MTAFPPILIIGSAYRLSMTTGASGAPIAPCHFAVCLKKAEQNEQEKRRKNDHYAETC